MASAAGHDARRRELRAQRRVHRPAGVEPAREQDVHAHEAAGHVDVPAQQVELRKRQILRADHQRHEEIAEDRRNRRDQEEEHHDDAVHGEELVVRIVADEIAGGRRQVEPDQHRERAADEEEERHRDQVEQRDALVVARQQPRRDAVAVVQIVFRRKFCFHHRFTFSCCVDSDLTYSISASSCSSLTRPWNAGMTGWYPAVTFAAGVRIDSRR